MGIVGGRRSKAARKLIISSGQAIQLLVHSGFETKTAEVAKLIELSPSCLKNYRLRRGYMIEGSHWVYTNSGRRMILYNVELLCDWVANRGSPDVHLRKIEAYLVEREHGIRANLLSRPGSPNIKDSRGLTSQAVKGCKALAHKGLSALKILFRS